MSAEWVTAIATIAAVIVALALAVFHEEMRNLRWRPKPLILLLKSIGTFQRPAE